jgi:hypothetical protein
MVISCAGISGNDAFECYGTGSDGIDGFGQSASGARIPTLSDRRAAGQEKKHHRKKHQALLPRFH